MQRLKRLFRRSRSGARTATGQDAELSGVEITEAFTRMYYDAEQHGGTWRDTYWMGIPTRKCPLDLWVYQEILAEVRPDVIVECGTAFGGSALFLASLCDTLGVGQIISIDIEASLDRPAHHRITYLHGSSISDDTVASVRALISPLATVMVILDSDHRRDHVLAEIERYSPMVSKGSYLVVEDTIVNGNPILPGFGPGPMEAIQEFLSTPPPFTVDRDREKFFLTFNPSGYLRRVE